MRPPPPRPPRGLACALAALLLASGAGAADGHGAAEPPPELPEAARVFAAGAWARARPPRPEGCAELPAGAALQAALDTSPPGAWLCLAPGRYAGPVTVRGGRGLWGPPEAVIASSGQGTTVRVEGERVEGVLSRPIEGELLAGAALLGLTVDGSGGRFDLLDAAVHLSGEGPRIEGVGIVRANFGILAEKTRGARIRGNHILGGRSRALGLRGDSVRLWESYGASVEENVVEDGRDVVVWYSSDNLVRRNRVSGARYGTHLMYSHRNRVEENVYLRTVVGVFIMYSRDVSVLRNVAAGAAGAAGMGLGLKESGGLTVTENVFLQDTIGVYIDNSPLQEGEHNWFQGNHFRLSQSAIVFLSSTPRNHFRDNSFRDNAAAVRVEGGGDALSCEWAGNDFDDYAGYDLDGDGVGDVPFELRSLAADLTSRTPELQLFRGAPALALLSAASELVPLLQPRLILRDPTPRARPRDLPPFAEALRAD